MTSASDRPSGRFPEHLRAFLLGILFVPGESMLELGCSFGEESI